MFTETTIKNKSMRVLRRVCAVLLLAVCSVGAMARGVRVWESPASDYFPLSIRMWVDKVEMNDKHTAVSIHFSFPPAQKFTVWKSSLLRAEGKEYKALSATGLTLDEAAVMPESGHIYFTVLFEPLPGDVMSFDCVLPKFTTIENIHDRLQPVDGLSETNWRNTATGDWLIGFADNTVIYDSQLWDIVACKEKKGAYDYTVSNGDRELRIHVGKEKKGLRKITIGDDGEAVSCARITSRYMPHYPVADTRTDFADNNYRTGDSVTIKGWYRNMNEAAWREGKEFKVYVNSLFSREQKSYSTAIDSLGRFTLRVPVENVTSLPLDWGRTFLDLLVEPGETYFLLKDFSNDQTLVMGRDARVQNEIFANGICGGGVYLPHGRDWIAKIGAMNYLNKIDSVVKGEFARIDSIAAAALLSERFRKYYRNDLLINVGFDLMQSQYATENLPVEYEEYVENVLGRLDMPYTVNASYFYSMQRDYVRALEKRHKLDGGSFYTMIIEAEKAGFATIPEADKKIYRHYDERLAALMAKLEVAEDKDKRQLIRDFEEESKTVQTPTASSVEIAERITGEFAPLYKYNKLLHIQDSLGWSQQLRDIALSQQLCMQIDQRRTPLSPKLMEFAGEKIKTPALLEKLRSMQKRYEDLGRKTLNMTSLYSSDDVKGLTEGEQILRKILEPMRGRIVLLDVWGTWCSPCKEALSHSQEEYERLKDYDIVYLYLANGSPDAAWRNVIKEYDVQGDNVVHYNLPAEQQQAVENFLKVSGFPTYRLIDAEGHLLDVNADPRDLDGLERVLKKITGKE